MAPSAETPPAPQPAVVARPEQPKTVVEEPLDSGFRPPALPVWGDGPPPTGYVLHEQRNTGLIVGGVVAFSAVYATSLIYGASANFEEGLGGLGVPLLGPWIAIASRDFSCTYDPTQAGAELCQQQTVDEAATLAVLSALGIGQLLGATLTVVGIFDKESLWIRADAVDARFRFDSLSVAGGSGLQIRGEF